MAKRRFGTKMNARDAMYRDDHAYDGDDHDDGGGAEAAEAEEALRHGARTAGSTRKATYGQWAPAIHPSEFLEVVVASEAGVHGEMRRYQEDPEDPEVVGAPAVGQDRHPSEEQEGVGAEVRASGGSDASLVCDGDGGDVHALLEAAGEGRGVAGIEGHDCAPEPRSQSPPFYPLWDQLRFAPQSSPSMS
jgi:hypothetical protein